MSALFKQNDFFGGMDTELESSKTPDNSYPLLINARARRDVIEPTRKHLKLDYPEGKKQGIYAVGSNLILFCDGIAYYADITQSPIAFRPIVNWTAMDDLVERIYAEVVPVTSNFITRTGTPDTISRTFNNAISSFPQALFVFDGITGQSARAIFADGSFRALKQYPEWSKNNPEYVPNGVLPAVLSNKLFLVASDLTKILHSVSGRVSDFVINITPTGERGGDAFTVAQSVSFNPITAIKPLDSGQLYVSTLFASYALELDYTQTFFGEPYLKPVYLFPAGALNELSIIDILGETAIITQSGIHSFNAVMQTKRESNNFPLGAKIRGLLNNPQANTCAIGFNDYAHFALNTIHGKGVIVYDTIRKVYQSLDLSFGDVKQFAVTKLSGSERLFFITHDDRVYEAFAGKGTNAARVYLGEWTPETPNQQIVAWMVYAAFVRVRSSGEIKISVYMDRQLAASAVVRVNATDFQTNPPVQIPFDPVLQVVKAGYQFENKARGWKMGVLLEWNFDGELSSVSVDGQIEQGDNVELSIEEIITAKDSLAFVSRTGGSNELNPGGNFPADAYLCLDVVQGERYYYNANGNGSLVCGDIVIESAGTFIAKSNKVAIRGNGAATFTLRSVENFYDVLDYIYDEKLSAIIGGGNHAYPSGSSLDVVAGKLFKISFHPAPGDVEYGTESGKYFFGHYQVPQYYSKSFTYVDVFFYNSNLSDFDDPDSLQASWLKASLSTSTAKFKFVVSNDALSLPLSEWGASALLLGNKSAMERVIIVGEVPRFICGAGGRSLGGSAELTGSAFFNNTSYGYLHISADALTCEMTFRNTDGNILDRYALYAI